ncbi:hypothetical protein KFE25_008888 [Diacronema lutheri]|uniref:Uncharacterized protein n=1 Tax=Diacronema lutheri TaxID=2081491 RepID=A0A8J6CD12_DIALT|nr:hypothetical protein KFE25_008888 [Diacronema lutheri]
MPADVVPVVHAGSFFDDDAEADAARRELATDERARAAAQMVQRACRRLLAQRELGERLYARLEADLAGAPRPAALRVMRKFPHERLPALILLQRRFRSQHGSLRAARGVTVPKHDDVAALYELAEEAGLFFAREEGEQSMPAIGSAFMSQLDKPFSAETAAVLSLDDLNELTAVLNRNISTLRAELEREQQARADLTEQCERRERLIEQIVFRVGKHYRARKQVRKRAAQTG